MVYKSYYTNICQHACNALLAIWPAIHTEYLSIIRTTQVFAFTDGH